MTENHISLAHVRNLVRNWLVYRHLCHTVLPGGTNTMEMKLAKVDGGRCKEWKVGELIEPLPQNAKY